jgi:signal transduction histidine kinase
MHAQFDTRTERNRLRLLLGVFFLALAVPAVVLVQQAFKQLELDAFRRHQLLAEEFSQRIDQAVAEAVRSEDARRFTDYAFLVVAGAPEANFLQQSPLAGFPVVGAVPGVIGYFQIDSAGALTTPLLPGADVDAAAYGITAAQQAERLAVERAIRAILGTGTSARDAEAASSREGAGAAPLERLEEADNAPRATAPQVDVPNAAAPRVQVTVSPQTLDSLLNAAQEEVVVTGSRIASAPAAAAANPNEAPLREPSQSGLAATPADERGKRFEQSSVPEPATKLITMFESEVDPLQFTRLATGHLVMFRNVWRNGERLVQGAVIDTPRFVEQAVATVFAGAALSATTSLQVRYRGVELAFLPARDGDADTRMGRPLYATRLSPPLADLELSYLAGSLPPGPGQSLLVWVSVVLSAVLLGGFFTMYRFGIRQITLRRQQQDFVSAVSHELKTPLTSIRMYGEMLKEGWAGEDKKRTYYAYIAEESERLSRLIENVLALARMNRGDARLELVSVAIGDLVAMLQAKTATALERAGFTLTVTLLEDLRNPTLLVDRDAFTQIFINLVDNALKFAARAERKEIAIAVRREANAVVFCVRDFGPGVPRGKMKKLFELFYRPEDELTRTTTGTGIGLGLVKQLATAMHASVDVRNCEPGAEFRLLFPIGDTA